QYFNTMSANMEQVQKDVNEEIKARVDEINALAEEIATLNKQINVIEIDKRAVANELRDQRTVLVDRLSQIVDLEFIELPVHDTNNPDRETGAHRVIINIAGGQKLVDTNEFNTLACVARTEEEKVNQSDADGLYDVYWVANNRTGALGDEFHLYSPVVGGALWGLVQMRDGNNEENFRGTVTQVDQVNKQVTIEVTEEYLLDMNKCKLSDTGGKIKLGNEIYYYTDWTFDSTTNEYIFTIDESANGETLRQGLRNKDAAIGASVDYQGLVYYQSQMNEWVRIFSEKFNQILKEGFNDYGTAGEILLTGNKETDDSQYLFREGLGQLDAQGNAITTVSRDSDTYYRLTAKNFDVLQAIVNDPDLLATKIDPAAGTDEYKNVEKLKDMMYDKTVVSFRGASTSEFLTCILSDIALNSNSANTFADNFANIGKSIDNQRMSVSSVDQDEETVSLIKFQNAYNLASRMIQCMTEVYDRLILETGV
ncbi:MAG: flagellar hook-associated protein FlgK, partial [Lachnospiraceae bacterium]|nr:flagellar hook-associated protein FlgK [Lachnospiraceae bacterium]